MQAPRRRLGPRERQQVWEADLNPREELRSIQGTPAEHLLGACLEGDTLFGGQAGTLRGWGRGRALPPGLVTETG